ncbi:hypothetical protein CAP36_14240 [Chitinophagaceae bacterium IBVUCB2]|nr:hypothetical protein CAP36_14240 [Chitinophagaceae bacterium IBVUCB2]
MSKKAKALTKEEDVQQNADPHIDQDFPGFPHPPATGSSITPKTILEKKSAGVIKKDTTQKLK